MRAASYLGLSSPGGCGLSASFVLRGGFIDIGRYFKRPWLLFGSFGWPAGGRSACCWSRRHRGRARRGALLSGYLQEVCLFLFGKCL